MQALCSDAKRTILTININALSGYCACLSFDDVLGAELSNCEIHTNDKNFSFETACVEMDHESRLQHRLENGSIGLLATLRLGRIRKC